MQISAYQGGTKISSEVSERPLKFIGTHWNIRHRWFQLVPISFSLASCSTEFRVKCCAKSRLFFAAGSTEDEFFWQAGTGVQHGKHSVRRWPTVVGDNATTGVWVMSGTAWPMSIDSQRCRWPCSHNFICWEVVLGITTILSCVAAFSQCRAEPQFCLQWRCHHDCYVVTAHDRVCSADVRQSK